MHPIIAKLGPITIHSYGLMVAVACLAGIYVAVAETRRRGIKIELVYDFVFYLIVGSIIGARLYYLAFLDPSSLLKAPLSIFKIWEGGLAIHGAIFGGILSGLIFSKFRRISFWKLFDLIAPSIILGQAIGRIGCFLNGCCYGVPTESVFGVRFPENSLPYFAYKGLPVHPTQLYEFILNIFGFFFLWSIRKKIKYEGGVFLLYLIVYNCIRLMVSGLRGDSFFVWGTSLKLAQAISIIILIIAFILFIKKERHVEKA